MLRQQIRPQESDRRDLLLWWKCTPPRLDQDQCPDCTIVLQDVTFWENWIKATQGLCILSYNCMWVYNDFKRFLKVWATPVLLVVTNPPARAGDGGDMGSVPGSGRFPGGGYGNPFQYSCPMDRGAWQATVHRVTKSWTRLKWLNTHALLGLKSEKFPPNKT